MGLQLDDEVKLFAQFIPLRNWMIPRGITSGQQNTHMSNKSNSNGFITTLDLNLNDRLKIFSTAATPAQNFSLNTNIFVIIAMCPPKRTVKPCGKTH